MAHSRTDTSNADEGYASLDAEDFAMLGMVVHMDEGDDRTCDQGNSCTHRTHAEAETCATTSASMNGRAPTAGKKRGNPEGCELSKPTKRKGTSFMDRTGVPPQPLILKNQPSATCHTDNTRRRPPKAGSSKHTGVSYDKEKKKWKAQIMVQGKLRLIGHYDKEEDAAADYARAAFKYKPTKPSLQTYGGLDLSSVPNDLPLIRKEGNATGYAGVTVAPNKNLFLAKIWIGRRQNTLGTFDTAKEAASIYARAKYYLDQNELSKPKGTPFIDLTGVPPQPPILKNQLNATCYKDNSRRRPIREGSSKYTGVSYDKEKKKWRAQIMVQGKLRLIGHYDKEEDAAADYARAAFKYKPTKPSLQTYGGLDLSSVPNNLQLIRSERSGTGYKGVKVNRQRYQARIGIGICKDKTLGTFDTAEEAALIYARAQYYLDHKGQSKDKKKELAVAKPFPEEKIEANSTDGGDTCMDDNLGPEDVDEADEDPVDPCFIASDGRKVDGVAV